MNKCEKFVRIIPNTIKDKSLKLLSFMERETRLELATSSLARRHSTTELPPHRVTLLFYMLKKKYQALFLINFRFRKQKLKNEVFIPRLLYSNPLIL